MDDAPVGRAEIRTLHQAHAGPLFAYVYRGTHDRGTAEEIVQDTFVRAWRSMDTYDPARGEFRGWLFGIARNLMADHHRRAARGPAGPVPGDRFEGADPDAAERVLEAWQIADALRGLTAAHREAIVAVHLRGYSVAEAATQLGVPPGTVKSRVYYGLRALRLALEEQGVLR